MLNVITIQGRLVRDPVLRRTQSETPVTSFTIACDRDRKSDGGSDVDFIDCVAWRRTAEFVERYFSKGSLVVVHGRLGIREWTDRDGNKRRTPEIDCTDVYFGEGKRKSDPDDRPPAPEDADAPTLADVDDGDGQLPF